MGNETIQRLVSRSRTFWDERGRTAATYGSIYGRVWLSTYFEGLGRWLRGWSRSHPKLTIVAIVILGLSAVRYLEPLAAITCSIALGYLSFLLARLGLRQLTSEMVVARALLIVGVVVIWLLAINLLPQGLFNAVFILGAVLLLGRSVGGALFSSITVKPYDHLSYGRMKKAFNDAGILVGKKERDKRGDMVVRYPRFWMGKPTSTDTGLTVDISLPAGYSWEAVLKNRGALASALRVPVEMLQVMHHAPQAEHQFKLWVGRPREKNGPTLAPLIGEVDGGEQQEKKVVTTDWTQPIRIGLTQQGAPVTVRAPKENFLIGGIMGSGKTVTLRVILSHFLLDPKTTLYGLDGKGSVEDYGDAIPYFKGWVDGGTADDPGAETLVMFQRVYDEMMRRQRIKRKRVRGESPEIWPAVLLLLEEFQDIRSGADKEQRAEIDALLGRIIRKGRAVSIITIISTQRPTVDDIPSGTRNLLSQKICLRVRNKSDAGIILGTPPDLDLPQVPGEGLFAEHGDPIKVELDYLSEDGWETICDSAASIRPRYDVDQEAEQATYTGLAADDDEVPFEDEQQAVRLGKAPVIEAPTMSPLEEHVRLELALEPRSATDLLAALPEEVRPASRESLGKTLGKLDGVVKVRTADGKGWVWQLV